MPPPPELSTDLVGEILLRLPPDDPASLVRASLVCKPWRSILSGPAFPRRYRAFHREPPLLGFFHNRYICGAGYVPLFVPTTAPSPFPQPAVGFNNWCALDCRHGRVLFNNPGSATADLVVWDPITGDRQALPEFPIPRGDDYTPAVLCAVHGCDHLDCHGGPFLVVLMVSGGRGKLQAHVYSSEAGVWNASAHLNLPHWTNVTRNPSAHIRDDMYFVLMPWDEILRYDLGKNCLSTICPPKSHEAYGCIALMPMEDGSLGLGGITGSRLFLYSRNVNPMGVERWIQSRVIELEKLITITPYSEPEVVGSAEGFGIIFVTTNTGVFTIELKSGRGKKVGEPGIGPADYFAVFPFMSFYSRGCASSKLPSPGEAN